MGSRRDCTWILGLAGFRVVATNSDDAAVDSQLTIRIDRRSVRRYTCSDCGRGTSRVRSARDRTWDDVPWASHPVTLIYAQRRVRCRHCGIRTGAIEFAGPKARVTRRLRQQIGVDCQSMHVACGGPHGVSWGKPVEASTRSCAAGTGSGLDDVPGIWAPTRSTAGAEPLPRVGWAPPHPGTCGGDARRPQLAGNSPLRSPLHQHFVSNDMYLIHPEHPSSGLRIPRSGKPGNPSLQWSTF